jgi:hypothetical protein
MHLRIMLHAGSSQLKLGVLTLPRGDNKIRQYVFSGRTVIHHQKPMAEP